MPKKTFVQNPWTSQTLSMSPPRPYTVNAVMRPGSPLDDDDDDDICPVCESECTCHNRANNPPSTSRSLAPTPTSTSTSITSSQSRSSQPPTAGQLPSLKIRLTVPPNLKFRKDNASALHSGASAEPNRVGAMAFSAAPKRRGRPPKAVVAAREAAKAALAASHSATSDHHPRAGPLKSPFALSSTSTAVIKSKSHPLSKKALTTFVKGRKKSHGKGVTVQTASSMSTLTDSDEEAQFPTFMSAASSTSLTSSSESSDIDSDSLSSDSDLAEEERFIIQSERDKARVKKELIGEDSAQKRRDHAPSNRWEIKPRKKSVGAGESDSNGSDESSEEEEEADDEDDGGDDDDDDAMEADVEEAGLPEPDMESERAAEVDADEYDGKLGVSFHGMPSGWSESDEDEDEESSFDAELFFANLEDDTSDSCPSPPVFHNDDFAYEYNSDGENFSADEEDALILMDVDPSTQIRRTPGEFEIGVDLDGLSFGLDGHLLPSPFGPFDVDVTFDGSTESDIEMTASNGSESDDEDDGLALIETDGETTEDELVDSDGLPNSRAMMLFRWPTSISTVDPLSTMSPSSVATPPPTTPTHASHTTRIALASMSAQHGSPAPTPADILAGKISMEDLEDIEIASDVHADTSRSRSTLGRAGMPIMGQFTTTPTTGEGERHAIIDGTGSTTPSPFPRSRILRAKRRKSALHQSTSTVDFNTDAETRMFASNTPLPLVSINAPSSDELRPQSHIPASDPSHSTDVIELDDVLDASFLDPEPTVFDSEGVSPDPCILKTPANTVTHMRSLTRWDRIPVATFRRTRETNLLDSTPVSDSGLSTRLQNMGALNDDMLGTPKPTGKSRKSLSASLSKRSKNKSGVNLLVISPVLMPVRDGDRTPTNASPSSYTPFHDPLHQQKSRRDQRKEKAMLKKKMLGKYTNSPSSRQQHHHHRHHYPNTKSRGSSSMQRTQFASGSHVPHLNL